MLRALALVCAITIASARPPNIVLVIADDLGWANVGFHRFPSDADKARVDYEVRTPNLDRLATKDGSVMNRFFAYKLCSPTRSSIQSGRLPVHVNVLNVKPESVNRNDPIAGYAGIPPKMTKIGEQMTALGYETVFTGKWDAGMATREATPQGSGYSKWLGYYHHANDYWTQGLPITAVAEVDVCLNAFTDLWQNDAPAHELAGTAYEERLFEEHSVNAILNRDVSKPLFLVHSFHLVHTPLQTPKANERNFTRIKHPERRKYAAMTNYLDQVVGRIEDTLKYAHAWDDTIMVFVSDNGGPQYLGGGANNYPRRGGKFTDFNGGVNVNAFITGGALPSKMKGKVFDEPTHLMHVADLYVTFVNMARDGLGLEQLSKIHDARAVRVGLPDVDGVNLWPFLKGDESSTPRKNVHLSSQAYVEGQYKIVVGLQENDIWGGVFTPNFTGVEPRVPEYLPPDMRYSTDCGKRGCLFDIFKDPNEHRDLSKEKPDVLSRMVAKLNSLNENNFDPDRGKPDARLCAVSLVKYKGFYGPFVGLGDRLLWDDVYYA